MQVGPREILVPYRPIPLEVPAGMKPNEFFNSTENLNDLVLNNGLLKNPENLLLYRKALGHSNEFDASIIYNTSKCILDPLGRPVRRTQVPKQALTAKESGARAVSPRIWSPPVYGLLPYMVSSRIWSPPVYGLLPYMVSSRIWSPPVYGLLPYMVSSRLARLCYMNDRDRIASVYSAY